MSFALNGQDYSQLEVPVFHEGSELVFPFVGGLNTPQFNQLDVDFDNDLDLLVFDRTSSNLSIFLWTDEGFVYKKSWVDLFPVLVEWVLLRDYNNDGIMDIFTAPLASNNPSIRVFKGINHNGTLAFEPLNFPYGAGDVISYEFFDFFYGLYVARTDIPALVDLDNDGDLDILSFESGGGTVNYYKNLCVESGLSLDSFKMELADRCWGKFRESIIDETIILSDDPNECAQTGDFRHAGSTLNLLDMDADGDLDVVLGDADYPSLIKIENGDAEAALGISVERGFPQYDVPVNINWFLGSYFLDVDNDGSLEMLVSPNTELGSDNEQHIWMYSDVDPSDQISFQWETDEFLLSDMIDWGSEVFPSFVDIDQDGLTDMILGMSGLKKGDQFTSSLVYYKNTGTADTPVFTLWDEDYLGLANNGWWYIAPTFGDLNGDLAPDLVLGINNGRLIHFQNRAHAAEPFEFDEPDIDFMGIDVGYNALPAIFDVNHDGLNDLLIGNDQSFFNQGKIGSLALFKNIGTLSAPLFDSDLESESNEIPWSDIAAHKNNFNRESFVRPYLIYGMDMDVLVHGSIRGVVDLYGIDVTGQALMIEDSLTGQVFGNFCAPALAEIDNDGYLEMLVGTGTGGLQLFNTDIKSKPSDAISVPLKEQVFSIYPNPANEWVNISFDSASKHSIYSKISLLNLFGDEIKQFDLRDHQMLINISDLPAGMYLVKINLDTGDFFQSLIVY